MTHEHRAALGWAVLHAPTREAYRRSTGEDAGPVLDRYVAWLEANIIGRPEDFEAEPTAGGEVSTHGESAFGTGAGIQRRIFMGI